MRHLLFFALFCLTAMNGPAQQVLTCGLMGMDHTACSHGLQALEEDQFSFIPPPADYDPNGERAVVINVTYNNFPANAEAAFEYAVDIWASNLTSSVPIQINATWASLSGGTLGFAGADAYFRNFSGAPQFNTFYPVALANKLHGSDLDPGDSDISCTFNSNFNWYFGTDGNTPGGQYDFVSVVLHELGHGLGCIGSGSVSGGLGYWGLAGDPIIYDEFMEEVGGTDITNYSSGTSTLADVLTGNQLYWNGTNGMDANSGTRPRMYAPSTWNGGSSYSHLNEGTYPSGNANSLMTPFLGSAEAIHDPGPIMYGMFTDMGWDVGANCAITGIFPTTQSECNLGNNTYNQSMLIEYENAPESGTLNVNGNAFSITSSPQSITLFGLDSDGQAVDVTAFFTAEPECTLTNFNAFTAPEPCCQNIRLVQTDPDNNQFSLKNFGTCEIDVSEYRITSGNQWAELNTLTVISGILNVNGGSTVVLEWPAWNPDPSGTDMALFLPNTGFTDPDNIVDFVQWLDTGNPREAVANAAGIWVTGTTVMNGSPYSYIGDGLQFGVEYWEGYLPPCSIDAVTAGAQSACDPATNTYTQELTISYTSPPATGDLNVYGQVFAFGPSPLTVTLTGLDSDGNSVTMGIFFTDQTSCVNAFLDVFTAPADCACPTDFTGDNITDVQDLLFFLAEYGCTENCVADLNGNGSTGSEDLLDILAAFGQTCD